MKRLKERLSAMWSNQLYSAGDTSFRISFIIGRRACLLIVIQPYGRLWLVTAAGCLSREKDGEMKARWATAAPIHALGCHAVMATEGNQRRTGSKEYFTYVMYSPLVVFNSCHERRAAQSISMKYEADAARTTSM